MEDTPSSSLSSSVDPSFGPSPSLLSPSSSLDLSSTPSLSSLPKGYLFEANPGLKCTLRDARLAVYVFCVFASRLFIIPLWTIETIPVLSPVYWQGHHWEATSTRTAAILLHISLGVVMLCSGLHQLQRDNTAGFACMRMGYARFHKAIGRVYVLSGLVVLASLQMLLPTLGQGQGEGPSVALIVFVETCVVCWVLSVSVGIVCAWRRQIASHRFYMRLSYAVALTPMTQRFAHIMMVPFVLLAVSALATIKGTSTWPDSEDDVWSISGYGRADEGVLPFSAWIGLLINMGLLALDERNRKRVTPQGAGE